MIEFLVIGLSAAIALILWKSRLSYILLPSLPSVLGDTRPDLTIVIPGRNPAEGKANACAEGARRASTKWVLFADAGAWFDPPFAASLVAYAEGARVPVVTVFLEQHCQSLAEKALLPYAFALYFAGVSARAVNNPKSREVLSSCQCILFDRAVYESIGGHSAVANSALANVALARHAKHKGIPVRVIRAQHLGHIRMYDGFFSMWRGLQKSSLRFLLSNPWEGRAIVLASILLASWLPVLLLGLADCPELSPATLLMPTPVTMLFLAPLLSLLPWYRGWRILLAPFAIYLFPVIALSGVFATIIRRRPTLWKSPYV